MDDMLAVNRTRPGLRRHVRLGDKPHAEDSPGRAPHARRTRTEGVVAGELDHSPCESFARECGRTEGRWASSVIRLARDHYDRALFPDVAAARSRCGKAARLAELACHSVSARPADAGEACEFPRLQGRAKLSLQDQGHR